MHRYTIPFIGLLTVLLCGVYALLLSLTVYYASVRTDMVAKTRALEGSVAVLESRYFESVAQVHKKDISALGFVSPEVRTYLSSEGRRVEVSLNKAQ